MEWDEAKEKPEIYNEARLRAVINLVCQILRITPEMFEKEIRRIYVTELKDE